MQSYWKNVQFEMFYGYFSSSLRRASDRSATFLTDLAGRTVKKLASPIGPGFESRSRRQKGHRSIGLIRDQNWSFRCMLKIFIQS